MALKLIGRTGKVARLEARVGDLLRIGAADSSDCRIVAAGVSRQHARVVKEGDSYWLEDAGSTNGTFLNGQRITRERLRHLDVVTLGRDVDLITVASASGDTVPPAKAVEDAWLEPIDPKDGVTRIDIPPGELTIGRLAPSNLVLDSPIVSQQHARIRRTADHLILQDLGSANGTFVNGRLVTEPTVVGDGDKISIAGARHFRVRITGLAKREMPQAMAASQTIVFDAEWKTRLMWSADELAGLEAERRKVLEGLQKSKGASASRAAATPAKAAAPPAARAAAPPATPAAPAARPAAPPKPAAPAAKPATPAAPVAAKPVAPPPPKPVAPPAPAAEVKPPAPPPPAKPAAPLDKSEIPTVMSSPSPQVVRAVKLTGAYGTFTLEIGRHTIGRTDTVAVMIKLTEVSRNHAAISVGPAGARVDDLGSANGTFVNANLVPAGGVAIKTGDHLSFGGVEFIVELLS